jgi:hypothetical protein
MFEQMSLPPPRSGAHLPVSPAAPSAMELVAGVLLNAIALAIAVALLATTPLAFAIPVAIALGIHPVRAIIRFMRRPGRSGRVSGLGALATFSILLLGAAYIAPEEVGIGMTALGLVTLLVVRLRAMAAGWAPRGLAWSGSRGSHRLSRRHRPNGASQGGAVHVV